MTTNAYQAIDAAWAEVKAAKAACADKKPKTHAEVLAQRARLGDAHAKHALACAVGH